MKIFRKMLLFLLSTTLVLGGLPLGLTVGAVSADTLILAAGQADGDPGETVTVPITISQNPGMIALKVRISYDPDQLELLAQPDCSSANVKFQNKTFSRDLSANPYSAVFDSSTVTENITAAGTLMTLTFKIKENAAPGNTEIAVTVANVCDFDLKSVPYKAESGSVTVNGKTILPGDVNDDGKVDGADCRILVRYMAGWPAESIKTFNFAAADVSADGNVTGKDLMILSRYVSDWPGYERLPYTD